MDPRGSKSLIRNRPSKIIVKNVTSGKVSRNPFINFLRDYRKSNKTNLKVTELTKRGAQLWRGMSDREKSPYINVSKQAPRYKQTKRRRRRRRKRRRRRRRRGRRRSSSQSRSRSRSSQSSVTSDSRRSKKKDRENKNTVKEEKHKEKSPTGTKKTEKPSHVTEERNPVKDKKDDEYEVKYKNSRYEDNRDFI